MDAQYSYFLSLPPCVRIGQFAHLLPFLRSGGRFSGSLSRIEPQFSVTRHCYGKPTPHHRKLVGQKLERLVVRGDEQNIMNRQEHN